MCECMWECGCFFFTTNRLDLESESEGVSDLGRVRKLITKCAFAVVCF